MKRPTHLFRKWGFQAMPSFILPKAQPSDESAPSRYEALVRIPADKAVVKEFAVDQPVTIVMKARIKGIESRESGKDADLYEITVDMQVYEIYGENAFEKMSREDESGG